MIQFIKIYRIRKKNFKINKKREEKEKGKEQSQKNEQLQEFTEEFNKIKDTRDKLVVTGNDIQKRLGTLTGISKPTKEELEEMNELRKELPELKKHLAVLNKRLQDIVGDHGAIRNEIIVIIQDRKKIASDIKKIQTVDISPLETALEASQKTIITYQENIDENQIIQDETDRKNKY